MHSEHFITLKDFAAITGRSIGTIRNIINSKKPEDNNRKGQLPPFRRMAGMYVVTTRDFDHWLSRLPVENAPVINARRGRPRGSSAKTNQ